MPQEINVDVIRKQITTKLSAIETAVAHNKEVAIKIEKGREERREQFKKEQKEWQKNLAKAVAKAVNPDNIRLSNNRYGNATVEVMNVVLAEIGDEPRFNYRGTDEEKLEATYKEVPSYYDSRGNKLCDLGSIIFHYKKALSLLDALPTGTATVTIKDFDFLTRY